MSELVRRGDSRIARFAAEVDRTAGRRVVGPYGSGTLCPGGCRGDLRSPACLTTAAVGGRPQAAPTGTAEQIRRGTALKSVRSARADDIRHYSTECGVWSVECGVEVSAPPTIWHRAADPAASISDACRCRRAAAGRPYGKCGTNSPENDRIKVRPARADDIRPYVVQPGLLHSAAALTRTGSISAHPVLLSKSKQRFRFGIRITDCHTSVRTGSQ